MENPPNQKRDLRRSHLRRSRKEKPAEKALLDKEKTTEGN